MEYYNVPSSPKQTTESLKEKGKVNREEIDFGDLFQVQSSRIKKTLRADWIQGARKRET